MSPYRDSSPPPSRRAPERCHVCGLLLERIVELELEEDLPWRGIAAETVFALRRARMLRDRFHGDHARCPGPPRVPVRPFVLALLELVAML